MPLVLIAAGILGGAALVRFAIREGKRINRELDDARKAGPVEQDSLPKLRRDPATGTYRPG
ncbi:hypothetical protein [Bradyrhizobium sp. G127]|jgi:hypothetical protein|uniref:hypothetical protein n=1 Tax=Bradyrhizobium sp. G127 TaxID=2904800 RepID=UPI001F35107F|nr:hypothetical protein [Bradyrhizobium sp. G127]MCF2525560.1 hypothetical protein [Bradyrhizobium sp. G127]